MILAGSALSWWQYLLVIIAGVAVTSSFAPFDLWPLSIAGLWIFAMAIRGRSAFTILGLGTLFGLGLFGSGASWVYVSIFTYGIPSEAIAGAATALFVLVLAILFAIPWMLYPLFARSMAQDLIAFPALWVAGEWLRGTLFTGFPWLLVGYAHTDTLLASWAPVTGTLGISLVVAFTAAAASDICQFDQGKFRKIVFLAIVVLLWVAPYELESRVWTVADGDPLRVRLVQGNIDQAIKWNPDQLDQIVETYVETTGNVSDVDLVIWPEAAIPLSKHQAAYLLQSIHDSSIDSRTGFITGIPIYDVVLRSHYNGLVALGTATGEYRKQHLVPFGEYIPLKSLFAPVVDLLRLRISDMAAGSADQEIINIGPVRIAPAICYEIAYAELVSKMAANANIILTLSNDTWFGASIGPDQHFQIARMRALENAKPVIRSTNNGITGFIDHSGKVMAQLPQFERAALDGFVQPYRGKTPFNEWGEKPLMLAILALLSLCLIRNLFRK
jgi:apolipoprotein N-acyltransferase